MVIAFVKEVYKEAAFKQPRKYKNTKGTIKN